ncbi:UNVERIFIED_CONTAM: putative ribonuclease H protein [Sesamum angustifolium]|uniref:Ribonuclease H protein n=1 Tax=Sesamum angustifolium TaxID=2727405 RepID=A0AAW2JGM9_9LAMI
MLSDILPKGGYETGIKRVFQIINEDGHTLTTQEDVVNEFVSFYQRLLGGDRRREFIDLRYLRPWARHVLTQEESQALVQSVTREEIKDAFFDIAEDKRQARMDTHRVSIKQLGRLLVNTTILALIPKVRAPSTVSDFRPISCCNVLYKVITKIIVQRLRLVLDKLISPSQNAFVPGRSIGDNILLAQELFAGYNRQGLPNEMCLEGFQGVKTRGSDVPVLVRYDNGGPAVDVTTTYDQNEGFSFHWRCKELGLFQLCFADDLLLFCKADVASVQVLDTGCTSSPNCPGYMPTHKRVSLFSPVQHRMSGNNYLQHYISRRVTFPSASRLSISDCKPLLLKIDSRIKGWESIQLSFAGRLQLIKSVLMSLNVYWAMAFILPKGVIREVEKKMRTFLWKGNSAVGYPKVAWSVVCKPIEEGGQGIRDILALNKALMSRHLWNVIQNNQSSIWPRLLITRFPRGPSRTNIPEAAKLSAVLVDGDWCWPPIMDLECIEILHVLPNIHNGSDSIQWRGGGFSTKAVYDIFRNHGPKVGWYSLLLGPCKIPRYSFVLWMAILEKLSTMDKPWLSHLGGVCVLCGREMETHEHLFFRCNYSRQCIRILKGTVRFTWPNRAWAVDIAWASKRWNGRHSAAAYRALLATIVYHIWQERNRRVFQQSMRPSSTIARIVVDEMRQKIISIDLPDSVSSRGLYRLWRIPWPVRGTA